MWIKEIVLDGFKSYAQRTVISDFDSNFNAITGLNGSGKSNVLDAICFVLGISNLQTVRAQHIQQLIYKNGQAGITRANVTILFDNSDKFRSHQAYKKYNQISVRREIAIGGQSKYTINGTKVTGEKVRNLFSMAGLNVNNANFLVMQGRITQVANMKPSQILSLVEQTAGTNIYEEHKKKALSLLRKKDKKLQEMDGLLESDLIPKIEVLQKENEEFLIWKSEKEVLENKEKQILYWNFVYYQKICNDSNTLLSQLEKRIQKASLMEDQLRGKLEVYCQQIGNFKSKEVSEKYQVCSAAVSNIYQKLVQAQAGFMNKESQAQLKKRQIQELVQKLEELAKTNRINQLELLQMQISQKEKTEMSEQKAKELQGLIDKKQAMDQGLDIDFSGDRLSEKQNKLTMLSDALNQTSRYLQQNLQEQQQKRANLEQLYQAKQHNSILIENLKSQIKAIQSNLQPHKHQQIDIQQNQTQRKLHQVQGQINRLQRNMRQFNIDKFSLKYSDPEPGFDRNKVKGRVIRLIQVINPVYARAIQTGAGGKLYSVVVDTDLTAQLLLKKRTLGSVTLLPQNKMQANIISQKVKDLVERKFGGRAVLALDLIKYNSAIANSIKFVFGTFFVCENSDIAKRIAYDREIQAVAITIDCQKYDPSGIISGGEPPSNDSKLAKLTQIKKWQTELQRLKEESVNLQEKLNRIGKQKNQFLELRNQVDLKKQQIRLKEGAGSDQNLAQLEDKLQELATKQGMLKAKMDQQKKKKSALEKEIQNFKKDMNKGINQNVSIDREIQRLEKEIKDTDRQNRALIKRKDRIELKIKSNTEDIDDMNQTIVRQRNNLQELFKQTKSEKNRVQKLRVHYQHKQKQRDQLNQEVLKADEQMKQISNQKTKTETYLNKVQKQIAISDKQRKKIENDVSNSHYQLQILLKQNPWLQYTQFDLSNFDYQTENSLYQSALRVHQKAAKKINMTVSATLDNQTLKLESLTEKRKIINNDKQQIQKLLQNLDRQKQNCIQQTWQAVNQNLSEIFSSLLIGADARLTKSTGKSEGLEFGVAFNNMWKNNLSELSGGQRSLLSLSFILALLKYNPAPIYILDEIDAALDLSHTQNIGGTVRQYFNSSQFIVVSLKEGMFTNANVLYRTSFHEGRSLIERIPLRLDGTESRRSIFK